MVYIIFLDTMYFIKPSQPQKKIRNDKMLMNRQDSLLLVIDVQERLAPAMDNPRQVISNGAKLIGVAKAMNVPFIITEQYPQGLGQTMIDIRQEAGENTQYYSKLYFSCAKVFIKPNIFYTVLFY